MGRNASSSGDTHRLATKHRWPEARQVSVSHPTFASRAGEVAPSGVHGAFHKLQGGPPEGSQTWTGVNTVPHSQGRG